MEGSTKGLELALQLASLLVMINTIIIAGMLWIFKSILSHSQDITQVKNELRKERICIKELFKKIKYLNRKVELLRQEVSQNNKNIRKLKHVLQKVQMQIHEHDQALKPTKPTTNHSSKDTHTISGAQRTFNSHARENLSEGRIPKQLARDIIEMLLKSPACTVSEVPDKIEGNGLTLTLKIVDNVILQEQDNTGQRDQSGDSPSSSLDRNKKKNGKNV